MCALFTVRCITLWIIVLFVYAKLLCYPNDLLYDYSQGNRMKILLNYVEVAKLDMNISCKNAIIRLAFLKILSYES